MNYLKANGWQEQFNTDADDLWSENLPYKLMQQKERKQLGTNAARWRAIIMNEKEKKSKWETNIHALGKGCAPSKSPFLSQTFEQETLMRPKLWASEVILAEQYSPWGSVVQGCLLDRGLFSCSVVLGSPVPVWPAVLPLHLSGHARWHGQVDKSGSTFVISCSFVLSRSMRTRAASLHNTQKCYFCWMTS